MDWAIVLHLPKSKFSNPPQPAYYKQN
jgi:hypothetical protein